VNNLNDGLAWGIVPLFLAAHGAGAASIGLVAAIYPGVWSVAQIVTGHWSDRVGRKPLIVAGMLLQAAALAAVALSSGEIVYRFWRDMGYAVGAVIAGMVADALGYGGAIALVAGLTAASGLWVVADLPKEAAIVEQPFPSWKGA
jgi:MFS family permease